MFFKQKTAYEIATGDWSSDECSSDLIDEAFWTVDTMFYSEMKIPHCAQYIFFAIKDIDFTRWDSGTGVPSMTASTLYNLTMIKPNKEDVYKRQNPAYSPSVHQEG